MPPCTAAAASTAYWNLRRCRPRPGALGQEPVPHRFQRQRIGRADAGTGERVGSQAEEDLAGEGGVTRVQRLQPAEQFRQCGILGRS